MKTSISAPPPPKLFIKCYGRVPAGGASAKCIRHKSCPDLADTRWLCLSPLYVSSYSVLASSSRQVKESLLWKAGSDSRRHGSVGSIYIPVNLRRRIQRPPLSPPHKRAIFKRRSRSSSSPELTSPGSGCHNLSFATRRCSTVQRGRSGRGEGGVLRPPVGLTTKAVRVCIYGL